MKRFAMIILFALSLFAVGFFAACHIIEEVDGCSPMFAAEAEPSKAAQLSQVKQIHAGESSSFVLLENGELWGWGADVSGCNPDAWLRSSWGENEQREPYIEHRLLMDGVANFSADSNRVWVATDDGALYVWGQTWDDGFRNIYDNKDDRVRLMDNAVMVSNGYVICTDDILWLWRQNYRNTFDDVMPQLIKTDVVYVSAGWARTALTRDGTLWGWGDNRWGQICADSGEHIYTPQKMAENINAVSAGRNQIISVAIDGTLYARGEWRRRTGAVVASNEVTMDNVAYVSVGSNHSMFITHNNRLYAWGSNWGGSLGDGTTIDRETPVFIKDNVAMVSAGNASNASHTLALTLDGQLWAWGGNEAGQLGVGILLQSVHAPVRVSAPLVRDDNDGVEVTRAAALTAYRDFLLEVIEHFGHIHNDLAQHGVRHAELLDFGDDGIPSLALIFNAHDRSRTPVIVVHYNGGQVDVVYRHYIVHVCELGRNPKGDRPISVFEIAESAKRAYLVYVEGESRARRRYSARDGDRFMTVLSRSAFRPHNQGVVCYKSELNFSVDFESVTRTEHDSAPRELLGITRTRPFDLTLYTYLPNLIAEIERML